MDLEHVSKRSKHSDIVTDGNGESKQAETLPKVPDESGGSKHPSSESVLPSLPSKAADATAKEGQMRAPSAKLISLSSTSSSASDSSLEDLFQVDTNRIPTSKQFPSFHKYYDQNSPCRPSTSCMSNVTNGSPTESPAIQMMDRSGGYDPSRIPSSVFARSKSNIELEWSVASNESLFSLHLGNNSFSRDHILTLGDFGKPEATKSGELFGFSPPAPAPVVETEINRIEEGRESAAEGVADENIKDTERASSEDYSEGRVPPPTVSSKSPSLALSHLSDGSGASTRSFAFPILTDGMRSSLKVTQYSEEQLAEPPPPASVTKKPSKSKMTNWLPCFSWCKWGCGCSCHRFCSCPSCSCPTCCR